MPPLCAVVDSVNGARITSAIFLRAHRSCRQYADWLIGTLRASLAPGRLALGIPRGFGLGLCSDYTFWFLLADCRLCLGRYPLRFRARRRALALGLGCCGLACAESGPVPSPFAGPTFSPLIRTGTNPDAREPAAAANLWRHTVSSPRTTPFRRATSEMFAPSSKLFATIRAFSSAVHRRRRRLPVMTSIRRYKSSSCLASCTAFAMTASPTISSCQDVSQLHRAMAKWGPRTGYTYVVYDA